MSHQKALCFICELPTADGAVLAIHVDKEKLQTWFLNVSGEELVEEIEDDDLICYFCLWHAEFLWKFNGMSDEALVWWNLDLDEAAKELRKHYFEGSIEQCWVPLEELDLPESEKEENKKVEVESESETQSNICPEKQKCLYCGSGGLTEMSLQKALCLICERPTADGAVLAVQVDKDKLQEWFLNVCGHEMAEEVDDDDLICYFCLWHAEFQLKFDELADEALVWWNLGLELDDAAREIRKKYFEGELEQCWVQLEKIELSQSADGEERQIVEAEIRLRRWNCIYCGKIFKYSFNMYKHVKKMHKQALRCENQNCATYFHTLEEKEEHIKSVHDKQKEREKFECSFCGKGFEGPKNYNQHVRLVHKEFPVKCSRIGCLSYFKTKIEMTTHFDSAHGEDDMAKMFKCNDCDYKAMKKSTLKQHIANKHLMKSTKCKMCERLFPGRSELRTHVKRFHNFEVCALCKMVLTVHYKKNYHLKITKCNQCKSKFRCLGLHKSHLKSCKNMKNQYKRGYFI
ncbi:Hypothetical predicted protein [Cloeon dipterum]|uniref:C2H2-type domain-containing protein n=1 Tax=Cloeon dipterum TaxID=197152 RepID=A0A8S1DU42_9INSE|nr:Hypothetical predicted protein [Cloeon dipterum]